MVMAWRFGAVGAESVMAVVSDASLFGAWIVAVPPVGHIDPKWPYVGAVVRKATDREPHGRHSYDRHLTIAVVEAWEPPHEFVLRLRSGLGGWIRLSVRVQPRPGGCLVEVRSDPLTVSARLRYAGSARSHAEERCAAVAENLLRLATDLEADSG
ncbi:hypothetical protein [Kribbella sp. NBC_00889]|uniref:hypothetical protein n=1 Tax=Kribbella sp. NBC_00889 TaxID=2975974 RepID=UPI003863EA4D|nr:hypothetical protein OG817_08890 [Kribbella sp. NBC_00889]